MAGDLSGAAGDLAMGPADLAAPVPDLVPQSCPIPGNNLLSMEDSALDQPGFGTWGQAGLSIAANGPGCMGGGIHLCRPPAADAGIGFAYIDVPGADPGKTYGGSAWILAPSPGDVSVTILFLDGKGAPVAANSSFANVGSGWQLMSVQRQAPVGDAGAIKVRFEVILKQGSPDQCVDLDQVWVGQV